MRPKRQVRLDQDRQAEASVNSIISDIYSELTNINTRISAIESDLADLPISQMTRYWEQQIQALSKLTEDIGVTIDGGGAVITTGSKGYRSVDFACTVVGWTIIGDLSGSIVIDVKRCTYAGFPTTTSIAGSEKPTLSSQQKNQNMFLTTWLSPISAGDILEYNVDSAATVTRVVLILKVKRL
jgi:hypothetical protein